MKCAKLLWILAITAFFIWQTAEAHRRYESALPNGSRVTFQGKTCGGLGHVGCTGKGREKATNTFGKHYKRYGRWTVAFCQLDSDGDGLTNGEELGDPCCEWTPGKRPYRTTDLSHPGEKSSKNNAMKCNDIKKLNTKTTKTEENKKKGENENNQDKNSKNKQENKEEEPQNEISVDADVKVGPFPLWSLVLLIGGFLVLLFVTSVIVVGIARFTYLHWRKRNVVEVRPLTSLDENEEEENQML